MPHYVALLRGINVGGANVIRMSDLAECCLAQGLGDVKTYIASGNVLFSSASAGDAIGARLEKAFSSRFNYKARVAVIRQDFLAKVVRKAPTGFGAEPKKYRYDVIFLLKPMTAAKAVKDVETKDGVDRVWAENGVLYFSRLVAKATSSRLSRIAQQPVYKNMTIRNWNTTSTLFELMEERS